MDAECLKRMVDDARRKRMVDDARRKRMVDDARRILAHLKRSHPSAPEEQRAAWRDELRGRTEDELVDLSRAGDVDAQELLRERLRDPRNLTPAVVCFLVAWFVNGPPKKLRFPKLSRKHTDIAAAVSTIHARHDVPIHHPPEHRGELFVCAIDIVAEAAGKSWKSVDKIYGNWNAARRRKQRAPHCEIEKREDRHARMGHDDKQK